MTAAALQPPLDLEGQARALRAGARPLIALATQLHRAVPQAPEGMKGSLAVAIDRFERDMAAAGWNERGLSAASWVLCSWIDEVVDAEVIDEGIGDLRREPLLDLRTLGEHVDEAGDLAQPRDLPVLGGDVAHMGDPVEGHEVVLTRAVDLDVAHEDEFVVVDVEGDEERYTIVGAIEAKPTQGLISNESPVGKAILGLRPGEVAMAAAPHGAMQIRVVRIES